MEKNLTQGSVLKNIMYFALPYLLSYFLQQLYGMADLYMIGMFGGVDGTTAVTNGSQVMYMLTVIIVGLAMGATVMIGKAVGGGKLRDAAAAIGNTVTLFMGLSVVITAVLLCVARPVVLLIGTPAEAVEGTVSYLIICFIGIPFIVAYNIISSIFRGYGRFKKSYVFHWCCLRGQCNTGLCVYGQDADGTGRCGTGNYSGSDSECGGGVVLYERT